ncbi:hypothetical protein AgCh_023908 [Apium graveolens]
MLRLLLDEVCRLFLCDATKLEVAYWLGYHGRLFMMDLKPTFGIGDESSVLAVRHEFWPVDEINPKNAKFPCCLVWTPLPVVSWLAPFIGHVGICKEDGSIIDFSGSNLLNVDDFAYGAVARYIQLDREKCGWMAFLDRADIILCTPYVLVCFGNIDHSKSILMADHWLHKTLLMKVNTSLVMLITELA